MLKRLCIFWNEAKTNLVGDRDLEKFENDVQALYASCVQANAEVLHLYVAQTTTLDVIRVLIGEGKIVAEAVEFCADQLRYEIDRYGRFPHWPHGLDSYDKILSRLLNAQAGEYLQD